MEKSNRYIFLYASILVIIVAAVLSIAAVQLKPFQDKNEEIFKKMNILSSVNIESTNKDAEEKYEKYITESFVINTDGELQKGIDAFTIDLKKELEKKEKERNLPVYVCTQDNGTKNFIIPVRGKGLWGPIWGNIALKDDYNTIYGATFSHKSETPGLGAEIDTKTFQSQFVGKKIYDESNNFVSIEVVKGGAAPDNIHGVDAISGGTITSKALEEMIFNCLSNYKTYFKNKK